MARAGSVYNKGIALRLNGSPTGRRPFARNSVGRPVSHIDGVSRPGGLPGRGEVEAAR